MTKINWKAESLAFAKKHNMLREMPAAMIEDAMKHGASLVASQTALQIKAIATQMRLRRKSNLRIDSGETKVVEL